MSPSTFLSIWKLEVVLCLCKAKNWEVELWLVNFSINLDVSYYACVLYNLLNFILFSFFTVEGVEHGLEFTIVRPFSWIGHKMNFIPTIDGLSEAILRVLPCFSNVSFNIYPNMYVQQYFFLFLITDLVSLSHICSLHLNMISFQIFNVVDNNSWTLDFFIMCVNSLWLLDKI